MGTLFLEGIRLVLRGTYIVLRDFYKDPRPGPPNSLNCCCCCCFNGNLMAPMLCMSLMSTVV